MLIFEFLRRPFADEQIVLAPQVANDRIVEAVAAHLDAVRLTITLPKDSTAMSVTPALMSTIMVP